ncbi:hypothetical protein [Bradyrhizobium sp.]|uniref:hypothetical protein n=1 Tax=Bradyrhizobium sp. TaxID=376 RepID=UPI003C59DC3A
MSIFDEALRDLNAAVIDTFSELVTIIPMTRTPNFQATPDTFLGPVTVNAVYRAPYALALGENRYMRGAIDVELSPGVSTTHPTFMIRTCELPWSVHHGYQVRRCQTGEVYEVREKIVDNMASTVTLRVSKLGKPLAPEDKAAQLRKRYGISG